MTVRARPDTPPATADTWSLAMGRRTPEILPKRAFGTISKAPAQGAQQDPHTGGPEK